MVFTDRVRRNARRLGAAGALCALAWAGACSSMKSIDRKIERSMQERSGHMGAIAPPLDRPQALLNSTVDPYDREPATRNPGATELDYQPADETIPVLQRLDSLYAVTGPERTIDLGEAFRIAQTSAREYRTAEEDYIFVAIRYLIEKHLWGPRFFDDITTEVDATSTDGDYQVALNVINELRITQRLPYGGDVEARLISDAAHQLVNIVGERTQRMGELLLSANIPLLRNAGLIAQEDLIQAQRNLVYAARAFERFRRQFLVSIAQDYFDLVTQQSNIENQEKRLLSVQQLLEQRKALVEAGRQAAFEARNVEQNVARSQSALASSQDALQLAKDRFKVRLGLPVETELVIEPVYLMLPEPGTSVTEAAQLALKFRLDYQNAVDRIGDQKRAVANAKNQILPDLDVVAGANFGNDLLGNGDLTPAFDLEDTDYTFAVTFGLPLDREIERLNLRQATILLERAERNLSQTRDTLIVEARAAVREIVRARFALQLQIEAIAINEKRLEQLQLDQEATTAQQQLDAQDNLLQSQNDRDQALRDLRVAILNYLLTTGQMRVAPDGSFEPIEGMEIRYENPAALEGAPGATPGPNVAPPGPAPAEPAPGTPAAPAQEPGDQPVSPNVIPEGPATPADPDPGAPQAAPQQPEPSPTPQTDDPPDPDEPEPS